VARAIGVGPPGVCRAPPWEAVGLPVAVTLLIARPRYPGGRAGELVVVRGEAPIGAARWRERATGARAPGARRGRPAAPALAGVRDARRAVAWEPVGAALSPSLRWTPAAGGGGGPAVGPPPRGAAVLGAAAGSARLPRGAGARPAAPTGSVAPAMSVEPASGAASTPWTLSSRAIPFSPVVLLDPPSVGPAGPGAGRALLTFRTCPVVSSATGSASLNSRSSLFGRGLQELASVAGPPAPSRASTRSRTEAISTRPVAGSPPHSTNGREARKTGPSSGLAGGLP
jgi:hypothetical protein